MKHKGIRSCVSRKVSILTFSLCIAVMLTSCFLKQDRTTVIYGTITDQHREPVDSIMVQIDGVKGFKYETLKQVYSDEKGKYELVVEVLKRFGSANVVVPFGLVDNPKYDTYYKGIYIKRNDKATYNCCSAAIGQKTKYDFQLLAK
jgi:hypothetical protein